MNLPSILEVTFVVCSFSQPLPDPFQEFFVLLDPQGLGNQVGKKIQQPCFHLRKTNKIPQDIRLCSLIYTQTAVMTF